MNKNKIITALILSGIISISNNVYAGSTEAAAYAGGLQGGTAGATAAVNSGFATYFSPMGIYTRAAQAHTSQVVNATEAVQATQKIQIDQQETNLEKQDYRSRIATGMAEIAKKDSEQRPTIQQCIEASKTAYRAGSGSSSGGGWTKGSGKPINLKSTETIENIQKRVVSSSSALAAPLNDMATNDTCSTTFGGVGKCSTTEDGKFSEGDIKPQSLKYNIDRTGRETSPSNVTNWTLNDKGKNVAIGYIANSIYSKQPKSLSAEEFAKNPVYTALYREVISKLNTAAEVLVDIKDMRIGKELTDFAKEKWSKNKNAYDIMFPDQKFPTNKPSMYEVVNFEVHKDYLVPVPEDDNLKGEELQKDLSRRIALSNYIAWKQYSATENTNILLANLLAQSVAPVNISTVNAEFNKVKPAETK